MNHHKIVTLLLSVVLASTLHGGTLFCQAQQGNSTLEPVTCPSTQSTFIALTEMVLQGRTNWLTDEERSRLRVEFMGVYNTLTAESCDAYFRKLSQLEFVEMTNSLGDTFDATNTTRQRKYRSLQVSTVNETTSTAILLEDPTVAITYNVTGTCRQCPTNGNFELYDDAFRRRLLQTRGIRLSSKIVQVQVVQPRRHLSIDDNNNTQEDCVCVAGAQPTQPQAPGVQQCIDAMNTQLDAIRSTGETDVDTGTILFDNVLLTDLIQLPMGDDGSTSTSTEVGLSSGGESIYSSFGTGLLTTITNVIVVPTAILVWSFTRS